jgi:hypothetical protein
VHDQHRLVEHAEMLQPLDLGQPPRAMLESCVE